MITLFVSRDEVNGIRNTPQSSLTWRDPVNEVCGQVCGQAPWYRSTAARTLFPVPVDFNLGGKLTLTVQDNGGRLG
jgi:hypothetical protein